MPRFALKRILQVNGRQVFEKLVVDGKAPFDTFIEELEPIYESEMDTMYNLMDQVANLRALPSNKYHPYSDGRDGCREWEFKTKHLRVYVIEKKGGKIVVIGGTKSKQPKTESEFHRLKILYINSPDYEE